MKKMMIGILCCLFVFSVVGCTSLHKQYRSDIVKTNIHSNVIADLEIGKPIRGSSSTGMLFGFIPIGGDKEFADGVSFGNTGIMSMLAVGGGVGLVESLKEAAAYKALENSGYEYIINPRYTIKRADYFIWSEVTCTVEGLGANLKGYRPVKDDYYYK